MGFWRRLFGGSSDAVSAPGPAPFDGQSELLKTLLELERFRLERTAEIDAKRAELDLKKAELELGDLERIGVEKRKAALFAEELKQRRREQAAHAREVKNAKKNQAAVAQVPMFDCEECQALREGRNPRNSHDLLRHKRENHSAVFGLTNGVPAN